MGEYKVNVTYHAPEGDSKVVEMMKTTFFDGTPVDIICGEDDMERLKSNPHFKVNSSSEHQSGDKPVGHTAAKSESKK